ncbi:hypothetical protein G5C60_03000 [Streptomyces sp. HC44]|uniref:Uncharacterized protein n=1 Tax=Streptomyces scabichelini TaxID=2711217 RepID=A0A6G4UY43_9ACTN|nr:hypothetical protein [Streptomyces scabichelini]NGO06659.1 hypothetical protein [Streptomyces scabichelini]
MSAYLDVMHWAAQSGPVLAPDPLVLRADQPYVPQQLAEGGGLIGFFTSMQFIAFLGVGLIALVLLMAQLWSSRREARREREEREEAE